MLVDVELDGVDVIELGCGTAYWSAWLARRGLYVSPEWARRRASEAMWKFTRAA